MCSLSLLKSPLPKSKSLPIAEPRLLSNNDRETLPLKERELIGRFAITICRSDELIILL